MVIGTSPELGSTYDEKLIPRAISNLEEWLGLEVETPLFSATGAKMPTVSESRAYLDWHVAQGTKLGEFASRAIIFSPITGCWIAPDEYRDPKGYVRIFSLGKLGLRDVLPEKDVAFGARLHRLTHELLALDGLDDGQDPNKQRDHTCRNMWCSNPVHTVAVSNDENDLLKRQAHSVEAPLLSNQLIMLETLYGTNLESFLDCLLEGMRVRVSTRHGAFDMFEVDGQYKYLAGVRIPDQLVDTHVPLPSIKIGQRKSRAKIPYQPDSLL